MAGGQPLVVTHGIPTLPRIYNTDPPSSLVSSWHMTNRDICRKVWKVYTSLSFKTRPNSKRHNALSFSVQTHHQNFQSSSSRIWISSPNGYRWHSYTAAFTVGTHGLSFSNSSRFLLMSPYFPTLHTRRLLSIPLSSKFLPHRFRSLSLIQFMCKCFLSCYFVSLIDVDPLPCRHSQRRIYCSHCYLAQSRESDRFNGPLTTCNHLARSLSPPLRDVGPIKNAPSRYRNTDPSTEKYHSNRSEASSLSQYGGD